MEFDLEKIIQQFKELFESEKIKISELNFLINLYDTDNKFPVFKQIIFELFNQDSYGEEQEIYFDPFLTYIISLNDNIKNEFINQLNNLIENKKRIEKNKLINRKEIKVIDIKRQIERIILLKKGLLFLIQTYYFLYIFDSYSLQSIINIEIPNKDEIIELKNNNIITISYFDTFVVLDKNEYNIIKTVSNIGEIKKICELSNDNILCLYSKKNELMINIYNKDIKLNSSIKLNINDNNFHYSTIDIFQLNLNSFAIIIYGKQIIFYSIKSYEKIKNLDLDIINYCYYDDDVIFFFVFPK